MEDTMTKTKKMETTLETYIRENNIDLTKGNPISTEKGKETIIGNTPRIWTSTRKIEETHKSYTDRDTGIRSYRGKISYYSLRNLPLPIRTHGLTIKESTDLLKEWGLDNYPHNYRG
jgi:hypothetical protein